MSNLTQFSEAKLHEIWRRQLIPAPLLRTTAGQTLEVINPGNYNPNSGPDFLRAMLRIAGKLCEGDVECHVAAEDWEAHGHHRDAAYNNVVLHIALNTPAAETTAIVRENGLLVPQLLLAESYARTVLLPEATLWPCPLSQTSSEKILATVRRAGILRLEAKAEAFAEQVQHGSWDQAVYRGLAEALGYDKNQEPFRKLAEALPIDLLFAEMRAARQHRPELVLEALWFGAAGFLHDDDELLDAERAAFVAPRKKLWEELRHTLQIRPLRVEAWHFFRLRPPNFPTRRLAALCQLILKFYRSGILEHLAGTVQALGAEPKKLTSELLQYFTIAAEGYWQTHYDLRSRRQNVQSSIGDLLGRERALDILGNIILPALWHYFRAADNAMLRNQTQEAYCMLPKLQENQITRAMREQLTRGIAHNLQLGKSARDQQGLIYLHKRYCRPLRCEECLEIGERSVREA